MKKIDILEIYKKEGKTPGAIERLGIKEACIDDNGDFALLLDVDESHYNIHGSVHGGIMYSICIEAVGLYFSYTDRPGIGMDGNIHYYRPAFSGDTLKAIVRERKVGRRTGVYAVELYNQQEKLVADAMISIMYTEVAPRS